MQQVPTTSKSSSVDGYLQLEPYVAVWDPTSLFDRPILDVFPIKVDHLDPNYERHLGHLLPCRSDSFVLQSH